MPWPPGVDAGGYCGGPSSSSVKQRLPSNPGSRSDPSSQKHAPKKGASSSVLNASPPTDRRRTAQFLFFVLVQENVLARAARFPCVFSCVRRQGVQRLGGSSDSPTASVDHLRWRHRYLVRTASKSQKKLPAPMRVMDHDQRWHSLLLRSGPRPASHPAPSNTTTRHGPWWAGSEARDRPERGRRRPSARRPRRNLVTTSQPPRS